MLFVSVIISGNYLIYGKLASLWRSEYTGLCVAYGSETILWLVRSPHSGFALQWVIISSHFSSTICCKSHIPMQKNVRHTTWVGYERQADSKKLIFFLNFGLFKFYFNLLFAIMVISVITWPKKGVLKPLHRIQKYK